MKILILSLMLPTLSFAKSILPASFSAQYENSWQSAIGGTKKEFGTIDYKYPSNVRLDVKSEPHLTLVTNKATSWYYQPAFVKTEQAQVTIQKSSSHPVIKFLDSLKEGVESSKYFSSKENGNDLVLTFNKEGQKEFSLTEVTLHGAKPYKDITGLKDIQSIDLKDANGKLKSLRFLDLKEGVTFPATHFIFSIPPNTKQIKG
ncbi:MAG: outer membrane lipoprotein carrier protein LolA [Bdellovibrionota bacterium]